MRSEEPRRTPINIIRRAFLEMMLDWKTARPAAKQYFAWFRRSKANWIILSVITSGVVAIIILLGWEGGMTRIKWLQMGAIGLMTAIGLVVIELYMYVLYRVMKGTAKREVSEEYLSKMKYKDFHGDDRREQLKREKEDHDFRRNLKATITLQLLDVRNIPFFDDFMWEFRPQINVLLGRNGYGKSHLLRALVSLLYKDEKRSAEYFQSEKGPSHLELSLKTFGEPQRILRTKEFFEEAIGKVPVLAIPDSRFINRSNRTMGFVDDKKASMRENGAYHFLYEEPYETVIQTFLYNLCFDHSRSRKKFGLQIFELLQDVVQALTDQSFKFHEIKELDNAQFSITVLTEGNEHNPLPIQKASQGTLSVLAMFGLIYYYLRSVFPGTDDSELPEKPAIVLIDEIDAHLHPTWQQKIVPLLRRTFPNIQFIITAHSPLVVAGCLDGEVAVLRKSSNGFTVSQFQQDFIGWEPNEIYRRVLEVEEKDESYLHYNAHYPKKQDIEKRVEALESEQNRSEKQERELLKLRDDLHYIQKARGKQTERIELKQLLRENEKLKKKLTRYETGNEDVDTPSPWTAPEKREPKKKKSKKKKKM